MCNKMSDVRLSNASPTLERVDARQADSFRPSVRRNLFGTPDPEEIRRYAAATLQEDVRGFRETYNFDPVEERPLSPRNYEWEEDRDPPEFYLRPPHGSQRDAAGEEGDRREGRRASRKRRSEGSGEAGSRGCHLGPRQAGAQRGGGALKKHRARSEKPHLSNTHTHTHSAASLHTHTHTHTYDQLCRVPAF
uniref:Cyclin-dependent kinase inhibitor 1B n=1 Tax=Salarias fasciatus TaxID=181472 RepID=A0A672H4U6_SALFA